MNPLLARLAPYPFERLRALTAEVVAPAHKRPINLSIGEPKHATPALVLDARAAGAAQGLANYPMTLGPPALREAIAAWLTRRHGPTRPRAVRARSAVRAFRPRPVARGRVSSSRAPAAPRRA